MSEEPIPVDDQKTADSVDVKQEKTEEDSCTVSDSLWAAVRTSRYNGTTGSCSVAGWRHNWWRQRSIHTVTPYTSRISTRTFRPSRIREVRERWRHNSKRVIEPSETNLHKLWHVLNRKWPFLLFFFRNRRKTLPQLLRAASQRANKFHWSKQYVSHG